jgi:3-hydroxy acid dehydrogenase / malonic semialdehyde reductase
MNEYTKTVLITGASSGFGEATARLLSLKGYKLILLARRQNKLEALTKELGTSIHIATLDIRDKNSVKSMFENLPEEFKTIDVLVNNAGLALGIDTLQEGHIDDWDVMIDTNIKGLLYMTKYCLDIMKNRNIGHIVNIGSVSAHAAYKGGNVYGGTKAFVKQLSRNLRADLFGTNIRVTNIEPGMAETEFSMVRFKGDAAKAEQVYDKTRHLTAEDIAETVEWVINRPAHVNIDNLEIMPVDQTWAGLQTRRD